MGQPETDEAFRVRADEDEMEAMLGAHRVRHGALRIAAASLAVSYGAPFEPEDVRVIADRDEKLATISLPDPRSLYTMTLRIEPDRSDN